MIEDNVLISVIVPIYNSEKYLEQCIESIINQKYSNLEIILVNDGSVDGSLKICEKYAKKDNRIKVIDKKNEGVSVARNVGMEVSSGQWISFIDSDDWIDPDMFKKILAKSKDDDFDVIMCNCYINKNNNEHNNQSLSSEDLIFNKEDIHILQRKFLWRGIKEYRPYVWGLGAPWCKLYSSKLIKENNIRFVPGLTRNEDGLFNLYILEYSKKICYLPDCYYHYRVLSESLSHRRQDNIIIDTEKNLSDLIDFSNKYNKDNIFCDGVNARIITGTQQYLRDYFFYDISLKSYGKRKKELLNLRKEDLYANACKKINYSVLPLSEKMYCFCFKYKLILVLLLMVKVREKVKNSISF